MSRVVAFTDLDRTVIYSAAALELPGPDADAPRLLCVEVYEGRPLSFMTERAAQAYAALAAEGRIVPVTTRTVPQLQRVHLPGPPARYALCANGGRLLVDGVEHAGFTADVTERLRDAGASHAEVLAGLRSRAAAAGEKAVLRVHDAAGLFCYAIVDRSRLPAAWLEDLTAWAESVAWTVSVQGRKLYCVPAALTKSWAATVVAGLLDADRWVAAGDSLLDADLLEAAHVGIAARHGELGDAGWTSPRVGFTAARGVLAGEEIVDWLGARLRG